MRNLKYYETNLEKKRDLKKAWNSSYCTRGTGIPGNNKRAHANRREHLTYHLVSVKLPVF